jgi:hypothetical protein
VHLIMNMEARTVTGTTMGDEGGMETPTFEAFPGGSALR